MSEPNLTILSPEGKIPFSPKITFYKVACNFLKMAIPYICHTNYMQLYNIKYYIFDIRLCKFSIDYRNSLFYNQWAYILK